MPGPDVGGSMGGHDPEKFGPIRTLVAFYGKKPHPFTACVRDNTKRFGPERVKRICAWIKDQARGTTHWRNTSGLKPYQHGGPHPLKEADYREMLRDEGYTERQIDIEVFQESGAPDVPDFQELKEYASMACKAMGLDHDPDGHDKECGECGSWMPCDHMGVKEAAEEMHESTTRVRLRTLLEADARPSAEGGVTKASKTPGLEDDIAASEKLLRQAKKQEGAAGSGTTKKAAKDMAGVDDRAPREVARAENGQIVYDDGSIKDSRTGVIKYPAQVFQDGSVRYDDGTSARPGSLAALMVMMPMSKEDRAKLSVAGPKGLPISEFASVQALIAQAVAQVFDSSGVGGMGELRSDAAAQEFGVASNEGPGGAKEVPGINTGLGAQDYAGIVGQAAAPDLARREAAASGRGRSLSGMSGVDRFRPIKIKRGEKIVQGPRGGRGVWRQVDGNPIFIKVGQSPAQATAESRGAGPSRR